MPESMSTLRFLLLNATAWLLYCLLSLYMMQVFAGGSSAGVMLSIVLSLLLFACSAAMRQRAVQANWWCQGAVGLLLRLVVSVLAGASIAQALLVLLLRTALTHGWVDFGAQPAELSAQAMLGYWLNTAIILGLWTALWASLHSVRRARQAELARLRAEAAHSALERDALRARLNPHFVFNALNNLRALILEDRERARDMVTRLSRTLRHALEHSRSEAVTLQDELAVVDDYLAIEAIHYEQRLRVVQQVQAEALPARLPPMALQVMVENAIKHGIATRPGGGEVHIQAVLHAGMLRVQVDNPLAMAGAGGKDGHGIGLAYLRAQLRRDDRFTLTPEGERMQAVLEVPQ